MLINCDMGESFGRWTLGHDEAIMPFIDMANIACGMHASDPVVMRNTVRCAKQYNVTIGAHPGYPDLQGFGRRYIEMPLAELQDYFLYQIGALDAICKSEKTELSYVKPHGALYNAMMQSDSIFAALIEALASYNPRLRLLIMAVPDSRRYQKIAAEVGVDLLFEAFVDRTYQADGRLTPRSLPGSSYHATSPIIQQAIQIATTKQVTGIDGSLVGVSADTLCIHGDGEHALEVAQALKERLAR